MTREGKAGSENIFRPIYVETLRNYAAADLEVPLCLTHLRTRMQLVCITLSVGILNTIYPPKICTWCVLFIGDATSNR